MTPRKGKNVWTEKKRLDGFSKPAFGVLISCWSPKIRESLKTQLNTHIS